MKYQIICKACGADAWIRGHYEPDTNATVLDDLDPTWESEETCIHIRAGEDYEICDEDSDHEIPEDYAAHDHGDSVWPR